MTRSHQLLFALFVIAFCPFAASAQVQTGTPPFGSYGGGPDIINLGNLNAHLDAPVFARAGRGGFNFTYDLSYDSSVWYPVGASGNQTWQPVANWGWRGQTEVALGYVSYTVTQSPTCYVSGQYNGILYNYSNWIYHDNFGVPHWFSGGTNVVQPTGQYCTGYFSSMTATTSDGSGWTLSATGSTANSVTSSAGKVIHPPVNIGTGAGTATDRNGNQISVNSSGVFTDTLGTTALTVSGSGTPSSAMTFTYTAPGSGGTGVSASYTMSYVAYTVATNFAVSGIHEQGAIVVNLVDRIILPDTSFYQFSYEQTPSTPMSGACSPESGTYQNYCVTARITKVTLPTGGYVSYSYTGGAGTNNSGIFSDGSAATMTRTVNDNTTSNIWTYAQTKGTGAASTTLITDPKGRKATRPT
jgi:hypothetical protein